MAALKQISKFMEVSSDGGIETGKKITMLRACLYDFKKESASETDKDVQELRDQINDFMVRVIQQKIAKQIADARTIDMNIEIDELCTPSP